MPDEDTCQDDAAADVLAPGETRPTSYFSKDGAVLGVKAGGEFPASTLTDVLELVALRERVKRIEIMFGVLGVLVLGMALHILSCL
jgi:hypothetical protein